jgi:hypothetical protein
VRMQGTAAGGRKQRPVLELHISTQNMMLMREQNVTLCGFLDKMFIYLFLRKS